MRKRCGLCHKPAAFCDSHGLWAGCETSQGNRLYLHGASASRMLNHLEQGVDCCVTATLLDGLVIARSLFHHSMNYRSVVLFGRAVLVEDDEEKMHALKVLSEHMVPGQWEYARRPTPQEVKGTTVLSFPIEEGSAKIRSGDPIDAAADYELPIWAGQIPLKVTAGTPIPDTQLSPNIDLPKNLMHYQRGALSTNFNDLPDTDLLQPDKNPKQSYRSKTSLT